MDLQKDSALETMAQSGHTVPSSLSRPTNTTPTPRQSSSLPGHSTVMPQGPSLSLPGASSGVQGATGSVAGATSSTSSTPSSQMPPQTLNQQGYPKEISVNQVEDKFVCVHCDLILRSPMQSDCGHRFCRGCCEQLKSLPQPLRCKACTKEGVPEEENVLVPSSMFDDKAAIREMKNIPTKCANPGCPWRGKFLEYSTSHEMNCDKKQMECSMCGVKVMQSRLTHHETSVCPKRPVTCNHCKEEMIHEQLEKHLQVSCPNKPVKCDKCSKQVPKMDLQKHKDYECVYRVIECPVEDCKMKLPLDQFPQHFGKTQLSTQKHMLYLFTKIEELQRQIVQMENESAGAVGGACDSQAHGAEQSQPRDMEQAGGDVAGAQGGAGAGLSTEDRQKLKLHEDLMAVLHGEILRIIKQMESLNAMLDREVNGNRERQRKLDTLERSLGVLDGKIQEMNARHMPEGSDSVGTLTEFDGIATWKIENFSQFRRDAVTGRGQYICSPAFSTGPCGYRMRMRFFPDGDGQAKGQAFSAFVQMLKGPYDDLLVWPFTGKIYIMLLDLKEFKNHRAVSISALPDDPAFRRPQNTQDSVTAGAPNFMKLKDFSERLENYSVRDSLIMRVAISVSEEAKVRLDSLNPMLRMGRR